jgi:thioredoxin
MPIPGVLAGNLGNIAGRNVDALTTVNVRNFDQLVLGALGPVAVEFMSYGCPHCRAAEPFVQQVAAELAGNIKMYRVNLPIEPELNERFNIQGMTPTFVMFQNGQEVGRVVGPIPSFKTILAAVKGPFEG